MAKKLLLIEDSLSIQALVESTFEHEDFELIVTDNAFDGLHKAQTLSPDIVLADASIPDIDGFQLCQRIRQTANGRHIPVVLLTSGFAVYDHAKGDLAGVTTHLVKPFAPHVLVNLVHQYVPHERSTQVLLPPAILAVEENLGPGSAFERELPADETPALDTAPAASQALPEMNVTPELAASLQETTRHTAATAPSLPSSSDRHDAQAAHVQATAPLPSPASLSGMAENPEQLFYHTLGYRVEQLIREIFAAQLPQLFANLMPHMLDTARSVVAEKMPEILAHLLQQEIDKLKRATAPGPDHD